MSKRRCYFIPEDHSSFVEGKGYVPAVATEGEAGYGLMLGNGEGAIPTYWGMDIDVAKKIAAEANESLGLTPEDVREIRISSHTTPWRAR